MMLVLHITYLFFVVLYRFAKYESSIFTCGKHLSKIWFLSLARIFFSYFRVIRSVVDSSSSVTIFRKYTFFNRVAFTLELIIKLASSFFLDACCPITVIWWSTRQYWVIYCPLLKQIVIKLANWLCVGNFSLVVFYYPLKNGEDVFCHPFLV